MAPSTREDAETAAGFLRGDAEAVSTVDGWIAGAASSFRARLGDDWHDLLQEARIFWTALTLLTRHAAGLQPLQ